MTEKGTAPTTVRDRPTRLGETEHDLTGRSAWETRRADRPADRTFQHAPVGVHEIDEHGHLLRVNAAFSRMLGYKPDDLVGRSVADFVDPWQAADALDLFHDLVRRGAGTARFDLTYRRSDGTIVQGRITATVIAGTDTEPASVLALVDDASGEIIDALAPVEARIDAVEIVAAAVARARDAAQDKGIDVIYAYSPVPVWVRADETQLRDALDHMLTEAVDSAKHGAIAVRCIARGDEAILEVLDVHDIDEAGVDLDVIFDGSSLSQSERGDKASGRSLGPAMALIRAQHGDISVSSAASRGRRVVARLPLARD